MLRRSSMTPCPAGSSDFRPPRDSLLIVDDDTTNIEFTTAFRASFRDIKPRRRQTAVGPGVQNFAIHEDELAQQSPAVGQSCQKQKTTQQIFVSGLAKPPQRLGRRVVIASQQESRARAPTDDNTSSIGHVPGPGPEPWSRKGLRWCSGTDPPVNVSKLSDRLSSSNDIASLGTPSSRSVLRSGAIHSPKISKPARRGTLYIPADDTTMPSVYMGIFSPVNEVGHDVTANAEPVMDLTGIAAKMAEKKGPRKSLVAVPPRRAPLRTSLVTVQESSVPIDVAGSGGGKENVPPGPSSRLKRNSVGPITKTGCLSPQHGLRQTCSERDRQRRASSLMKASMNHSPAVKGDRTAKPFARQGTQCSKEKSKPLWNQGFRSELKEPISRPVILPKQPRTRELQSRKEKVPTRFVIPKVPANPLPHYQLLLEEISNPSLYEENWLTHQEVAITQLVSNLFAASLGSCKIDQDFLRVRLLGLYQDSSHPNYELLYKRLYASISFGALAVPKETLTEACKRLKKDLGFRASYVELWTATYTTSILKPALEVIVGRQCGNSEKSLQDFIQTLLIRNEDGVPPEIDQDTPSWSYQRTFLRSLVLVKLLDQARSSLTMLKGRCLFKSTAPYKSSADVVRALTVMLNPAVGDAIRALNHIGYRVDHAQYALEEYEYSINNLAVDLRDGVKLTRLVELLLYPSASRVINHEEDNDATTMVFMPDGETLDTQGQTEWPLSQHLKFPCLGRATKIYNVQIALSALQGVKAMHAVMADVTAEDVVDGFREKTVKLLWGLVGKWGLSCLVDWDDVRIETRRLHRKNKWCDGWDEEALDMAEEEHGFELHKNRLKKWAMAVAESRNLRITNFSTSFADGKAFEAIVDEYEPYIAREDATRDRWRRLLHERLADLGCNNQFAQLFSDKQMIHIFDRDFVLAALAFLCSRLLSASKQTRSAIVLQRAWRRRLQRAESVRRRASKFIAEQCAAAVWDKKKRPEVAEDMDVWLTL